MRKSQITLAILLLASAASVQAEPTHVLLFDSGQEGYPRYRIPALIVTTRGTVLAFCEGRKDGGGLTGNIDIVLKRSSDSGKTWGKLELAANDADNTLGNPCPVVDRTNGTIWLPMSRSHGSDLESEIIAGTSKERTRVLMTNSKDDGRTWAKPRDITSSVKSKKWTWYGNGPGTGIQLANERLVIPSYHADEQQVYRSHTIFSDDHGKTWRRSNATGNQCGECYVVERTDGSLYLNARTNMREPTELRTIAFSKDLGTTWSKARFEPQLFDPHCQGCVIALPKRKIEKRPIWLFTNPAGPKRHDLTVRVSFDEGKTWPHARLLVPGNAQYSSLAQLPDGSIGCLYDNWRDGNYRLFFARFSLDWLLAQSKKE